MGIAAQIALISARRSPTVAGFLRYTTSFKVPQGKSPEVLNLVNVVGIKMYLFVLSSVLADSHLEKPARLGGSVGVPHLVGRRAHCFHKVHV